MRYLSIAFWLGDEKLLTVKSHLYPSYSVGDIVKLETVVTDDGTYKWNKSMDETTDPTQYKVVSIEHYIKKVFDKKILYKVRMDVHLEKL